MALDAVLLLLHTLGIALGTGGATIANLINIKSEKNPELAPAVMRLLPSISKVIWAGLFLMLITHATEFFLSPALITGVQLLVVLLLLAAGATITLVLMPKLLRSAPKPPAKPSSEFLSTKSKLKILGMGTLALWYLDLVLTVLFP